ncbi:hypothetical protein TNCV_3066421 [Trichonephila clavipes]|uniref:Uncharacterized protein n=1 Tax=Trichonephila clavipes TaxID=2585209 RepID=A0A8X6RWK0_TRICX|nr:hypothetical protein TNCV_3066421 [Trichonephila clavipes]
MKNLTNYSTLQTFIPRQCWRLDRFNAHQRLYTIRHLRRPGSIPLQSKLIVHDTTPNRGVVQWVSLNVLKPGTLRWFGTTQKHTVQVLPECGQQM